MYLPCRIIRIERLFYILTLSLSLSFVPCVDRIHLENLEMEQDKIIIGEGLKEVEKDGLDQVGAEEMVMEVM